MSVTQYGHVNVLRTGPLSCLRNLGQIGLCTVGVQQLLFHGEWLKMAATPRSGRSVKTHHLNNFSSLKGLFVTSYTYKSLRVVVPCALACGYAVPTQTTRKHQNRKVISGEARPAKQCQLILLQPPRPLPEDTGETLVSGAGVSALRSRASLTHRARSQLAPPLCTRAHYTLRKS